MTTSVKIMPKPKHPVPAIQPLVVLLAYDGLCMFEFGCAFEVFGLSRPEMGQNWYRCRVAAAEAGPLRGGGGMQVVPDGGLELLAEAAIVIVPGWRGVEAPVPQSVCTALRDAHRRGTRIVSLCSGAFVLGAAGLLQGRRATTHWLHAERLVQRFPDVSFVPDVLYVDEGSVLTAAGSAAALDLCLHIVRQDKGPEAANKVARRLVIPAHRQGGQAQFVERPVPRERSGGSRLALLLDDVRAKLDQDWTVERLAAQAAVSPRALHRRFQEATGQSPGSWLVAERVSRARELLESSDTTLDEIAAACGFGSIETLRHHFRRQLGTSPGAYRARFGQGTPGIGARSERSTAQLA